MLLIAAGALFALLVLIIILLAAQNSRIRRERIQQEKGVDRLNQAMGHSLRQMAELSGALDARMEALTRQNDEKLTEMRRVVGESLDGRLSQSFRVVNSQLADVHRGIGEMRDLAQNVTDLKKVLGNVKTRGVWGEMQLRAILAEMFAPDQYIENAAIPEGSASRVEFALKIPGAGESIALLPIDSKFPQEDYLRLVDAEDPEEKAKCARQLERALMEQAKIISEKYIRPPQTVDFAVMFLPVEGLYAEAARSSGLIERIQMKYRVLIAGPATLCALLTSLQMGLRSSELEKRSGEILQLFEELRADFTRFQEGITRARQRLNQAESELDALESRARKISKKLN
jgi:DNA recombination protein RmuC